MIPYGRQHVTDEDIQAVVEVLRSEWLTQGPAVGRFEMAVAEYCRSEHAVAVNSATAALHLACLALDLGPGDSLWTSPITFVASANCGLYCGADVDFVDIDPRTYNLCPKALEEKLEWAERNGRLPKVVMPVHLCGQSCDMAAVHELGKRYGFRIIEDASHALGGTYQNEPIGCCRFSDITVFSFHPVKIITTGEGGMAVTNDAGLGERMTRLRSHGITRDPDRMLDVPHGPWYYEQIELGFNYRMTDMQAALGLSQLTRLDDYVTMRHEIARHYNEQLADLKVILPWQRPNAHSAYHLYVLRIQAAVGRPTHDAVFRALREAGIGVNLHYIPVPSQPYYKQRGFKAGDFPEAEAYYAEAISLPMYPTLTRDEQESVIHCIRQVLVR